MARFNTGNPIGSGSPLDLDDNAKNFDEAALSDADTFQDRLGRSRLTWAGMENRFSVAQDMRAEAFNTAQADREQRFNTFIASSGYSGTGPNGAIEDYAPGITLNEYNQIIRDSSGEFWRLSGSTELPYTTTGAGLPEGGALAPVGDAVLRQQLADPDMGAAMVGYAGGTVADRLGETVSVKEFGAVGDGVTDDTAAIQAALHTGLPVFLPPGIYRISDSLIMRAGYRISGNSSTGPQSSVITTVSDISLFKTDQTTRQDRISISNLEVHQYFNGASRPLVDLEYISYSELSSCRLFGRYDQGEEATELAAGVQLGAFSYYNSIRHNVFTGLKFGVYSVREANGNEYFTNTAVYCYVGMYLSQTNSARVFGCSSELCYGYGVYITENSKFNVFTGYRNENVPVGVRVEYTTPNPSFSNYFYSTLNYTLLKEFELGTSNFVIDQRTLADQQYSNVGRLQARNDSTATLPIGDAYLTFPNVSEFINSVVSYNASTSTATVTARSGLFEIVYFFYVNNPAVEVELNLYVEINGAKGLPVTSTYRAPAAKTSYVFAKHVVNLVKGDTLRALINSSAVFSSSSGSSRNGLRITALRQNRFDASVVSGGLL